MILPPPPPQDAPPRKKWPWIVAAIVVVAIIAAAVAFWVVRGDDTDQVKVPDVAGQTAAEAVSAVRAAGFQAKTAGQVSTTVNKGLVIRTSPAGGDSADTGSTVTITVSQGTGTVSVPALVGLTEADATGDLTSAGLESRVVQAPSATVDQGVVITQDPAAGLQIDVGSTVAITVSTGPAPVAVPDVTGQTLAAATQTLQQAGLRRRHRAAAAGPEPPRRPGHRPEPRLGRRRRARLGGGPHRLPGRDGHLPLIRAPAPSRS